eukprot:Hpha_TRINITY_DN16696_c1_g1::TRINITY_DN16696_c1_g1_i1::g.179552::m.179552
MPHLRGGNLMTTDSTHNDSVNCRRRGNCRVLLLTEAPQRAIRICQNWGSTEVAVRCSECNNPPTTTTSNNTTTMVNRTTTTTTATITTTSPALCTFLECREGWAGRPRDTPPTNTTSYCSTSTPAPSGSPPRRSASPNPGSWAAFLPSTDYLVSEGAHHTPHQEWEDYRRCQGHNDHFLCRAYAERFLLLSSFFLNPISVISHHGFRLPASSDVVTNGKAVCFINKRFVKQHKPPPARTPFYTPHCSVESSIFLCLHYFIMSTDPATKWTKIVISVIFFSFPVVTPLKPCITCSQARSRTSFDKARGYGLRTRKHREFRTAFGEILPGLPQP